MIHRPVPPVRRMLSALLCAAAPALAGAADTATVQTPGPMYAHPDAGARKLAEIHRRASVLVLEVRRDWVRIEAAGNRQGWVQENALSFDPPAPAANASPPSGLANGASALRPRVVPRSTQHALIATFDGPDDPATAANAVAMARLLGVPDINIARFPDLRDGLPQKQTSQILQRTLGAFGEVPGHAERVFLHVSGRVEGKAGKGTCTETLRLPDGRSITIDELARQADALAGRVDKVFLVIDGEAERDGSPACSRSPSFHAPANLLYIGRLGKTAAGAPRGQLTDALLACLDGRGPRSAKTGLASGDELTRCARRYTGQNTITVGGNPALIPALISVSPAAPVAPREMLHTLYGQRSPRRSVEVQRQPSPAGKGLAFAVRSTEAGHLYVLAASDDGFALLYPTPAAPDLRLEDGTTLTLPARDAEGRRWTRLLFLVSDARRNFLRAGFGRSGEYAFAPADARTLRDLPLEILGGDSSPTCQQAEMRNLGARQALECSVAYGAQELDVPVETALDKAGIGR